MCTIWPICTTTTTNNNGNNKDVGNQLLQSLCDSVSKRLCSYMQLFSALDFCLVIMFVCCRRHTQMQRGETEGGGHEELPAYENRSVTENIDRSRLGFLCWCCSLWHPSVSKPDRCTEVSRELNCRWVRPRAAGWWRLWAVMGGWVGGLQGEWL